MPSCSWRFLGRTISSGVGQSEGDEQQPRLVDVAVVLIDHGDLGIVTQLAPQAVRRQRPARAATEDHDLRYHDSREHLRCRCRQGRRSPHSAMQARPASCHRSERNSFSISSGVMPSALGSFGVGEAVAHAGGHQPQSGPVERGLGCVELGQHLLAVGALLDQALHAAELPLGAAEPVEHLVGDLVRKLHGCHSIPCRVSLVGTVWFTAGRGRIARRCRWRRRRAGRRTNVAATSSPWCWRDGCR